MTPGSKPGEISTVAALQQRRAQAGDQTDDMEHRRVAEEDAGLPTRPSTPKLTAVAKTLRSVMITPFGRPDVPDV